MDLGRFVVPIVFVVTAAPMFLIAGMVRRGALPWANGLEAQLRDPLSLQRRLSNMLAAIGFAIVGGAAGLVWADGDRERAIAVVLVMTVLVNGLIVAMLVAISCAKRKQRRP